MVYWDDKKTQLQDGIVTNIHENIAIIIVLHLQLI